MCFVGEIHSAIASAQLCMLFFYIASLIAVSFNGKINGRMVECFILFLRIKTFIYVK